MLMEFVYRRLDFLRGSKGPTEARGTFMESLAVGMTEPPDWELSRSARRFWLGNAAAVTGIAPVQALVTTAAQWLLWNADPAAAYGFEELGVYLTAGTPGVGGALWAALVQAPAQVGASAAGTAVGSCSNGGRTSKMVVKSGVTVTQPTAPAWFPVAVNPSPNVTAFASSVPLENRNLRGGLIVPPGQGLALAVVAPAGTTPLFAPFARWVECETDLE